VDINNNFIGISADFLKLYSSKLELKLKIITSADQMESLKKFKSKQCDIKPLLTYAKTKRRIVRLKGGDPIIFGRGGEEAEYLKKHKIQFEIVPGITSGIGSATYAGIPLTHRKFASSVVFVTGHEDSEKKKEDVRWKKLAKSTDTIVVMMGLSRIGIICKQLSSGGMDKKTPVAVIQDGTTSKQKMITGTISNIAQKVKQSKIRPPSIIIIG